MSVGKTSDFIFLMPVFTELRAIAVQLSDEYGRDSLVQSCPIHVDGGADRKKKASDAFVDVVVLFHATHCDGQRHRAVAKTDVGHALNIPTET